MELGLKYKSEVSWFLKNSCKFKLGESLSDSIVKWVHGRKEEQRHMIFSPFSFQKTWLCITLPYQNTRAPPTVCVVIKKGSSVPMEKYIIGIFHRMRLYLVEKCPYIYIHSLSFFHSTCKVFRWEEVWERWRWRHTLETGTWKKIYSIKLIRYPPTHKLCFYIFRIVYLLWKD